MYSSVAENDVCPAETPCAETLTETFSASNRSSSARSMNAQVSPTPCPYAGEAA